VDRTTSTHQLVDDADDLSLRLGSFGDRSATATVRGHAIDVLGTEGLPVPTSVLLITGTFQIRPALCESAPYRAAASDTAAGPLPAVCSSNRYSLEEPNLTVDTSTAVSNLSTITPDPALASHPSSSATYNDSHPESPVLVPLLGASGLRYLLGPSGLNGSAVASARAAFEAPQWIVDVTFTDAGGSAWDALVQKYFHEIIGIDLDGRAVSAPLNEPSQSTFTSFGGRMQIGGDFDRLTADELAAVLNSGPLATPLVVGR
jgi:preprotein translocase subunit SecD